MKKIVEIITIIYNNQFNNKMMWFNNNQHNLTNKIKIKIKRKKYLKIILWNCKIIWKIMNNQIALKNKHKT